MIDKLRRKRLALHLRHLSIGQISNDEFENRIQNDITNGWLPEQYYRAKEEQFDDPIIKPMLELSWCLYSDVKRHKLIGQKKLNSEQLKDIARFILFLHSDFEYEWKYLDVTNPLVKFSFKDLILTIMSLGKHYRAEMSKRTQESIQIVNSGEIDFWPFFRKEDFEKQLKIQPFLKG